MNRVIEARLRSDPPIPQVVAGSTPVPSFGNAETASVATLGINPSCAEFIDRFGQLLTGTAARFVSLAEARVGRLSDAPQHVLERVYDGCLRYFQRNPYRLWFDRLEEQLQALGVSYYDGSAAHLDLAHWATNPTWKNLGANDRRRLLDDGREFLCWQLVQPHVQLLLLNGRTTLTAFATWSGIPLYEVRVFKGPLGRKAFLYAGKLNGGAQVLGWSTNLQSSYGVTADFRRELSKAVVGAIRATSASAGGL